MSRYERIHNFLLQTLDGYEPFDGIEWGLDNFDMVLNNPEKYYLNHIGADLDAWMKNNRMVININNGVHFVFTPIEDINDGLKFANGKWT